MAVGVLARACSGGSGRAASDSPPASVGAGNLDAPPTPTRTVTVGMTETHNGFSITVDKVEFATDETSVFV